MKKVILITGASSGMGKKTAQKLIIEGHIVYTVARRVDLMQDLKKIGGHPMQMDVTEPADVQRVVETIIKEQGRIDVLWNNAGFGLYGSVEDLPLDEARRQFEVNVFGIAAVTQKVVPYMRTAQSGTIINTSSMGGKMYFPMGAWYHASKHAVEGLSDCLRLELKPFNVHVVVLEPGFIATEFGSVLLEGFAKIRKDSAYRDMMDKIIAGTRKAAEGNGSSKETGMNTQDHIHYFLIEEAKNILLNSDASVSEIAYALGFEYPQYFSKLFKQKTGTTPQEFRSLN